jgi:hypothetical protein
MSDGATAIASAATLLGVGLGSYTTYRLTRPFQQEAALNRMAAGTGTTTMVVVFSCPGEHSIGGGLRETNYSDPRRHQLRSTRHSPPCGRILGVRQLEEDLVKYAESEQAGL